jgi:hypothetical protein
LRPAARANAGRLARAPPTRLPSFFCALSNAIAFRSGSACLSPSPVDYSGERQALLSPLRLQLERRPRSCPHQDRPRSCSARRPSPLQHWGGRRSAAPATRVCPYCALGHCWQGRASTPLSDHWVSEGGLSSFKATHRHAGDGSPSTAAQRRRGSGFLRGLLPLRATAQPHGLAASMTLTTRGAMAGCARCSGTGS